MPHTDPEKRREYNRKWRLSHPNYDAQKAKEYRKRHPERVKKSQRQYYDSHKTILNQRSRQRYLDLKQEVFSKYSNGQIICKTCGEKGLEFLTLDHITGRKAT